MQPESDSREIEPNEKDKPTQTSRWGPLDETSSGTPNEHTVCFAPSHRSRNCIPGPQRSYAFGTSLVSIGNSPLACSASRPEQPAATGDSRRPGGLGVTRQVAACVLETSMRPEMLISTTFSLSSPHGTQKVQSLILTMMESLASTTCWLFSMGGVVAIELLNRTAARSRVV